VPIEGSDFVVEPNPDPAIGQRPTSHSGRCCGINITSGAPSAWTGPAHDQFPAFSRRETSKPGRNRDPCSRGRKAAQGIVRYIEAKRAK